jgi:hypothetical protein
VRKRSRTNAVSSAMTMVLVVTEVLAIVKSYRRAVTAPRPARRRCVAVLRRLPI